MYYRTCKHLKETGVFLRLLTQRIKNNGKTVQSSGRIADCKRACGVENVGNWPSLGGHESPTYTDHPSNCNSDSLILEPC